MESWIIFSLASSFLFAVVSILDKYGVYDRTNLSPKLLNMYVGFSNFTVGLIFLFIFGITDLISVNSFMALLVGMIQGASLIIMFWSLKNSDVTRVMPIWSAYPLWVALLAVIFTQETLTYKQLFFMFFLISGGVIANINFKNDNTLGFSIKSFCILISGTILFASSQIINKEVVQNLPLLEVYGFRGIGVCLTLALPFASRTNITDLGKYVLNWKKSKYIFLAETVLATFAYLTILYSLLNGPVSLVAAISGTRPVFIVGLYSLLSLLKVNISETFSRNEVVVKMVSAIFVTLGVFGIAFF
jgi:drug/metabolite transporter (DMT)-like permease